MLGSSWIDLLKRIPPAKQGLLVVVTASGLEFMVQKIIGLDRDFVILRGRLAGSADQGRIIMLPYDQIDNLAFNAILPEAEVCAMFGIAARESATSASAPPPEAADQPLADPTPGPPDAFAQATPSDAPPGAGNPAKLSKSVLLARLRARLATKSGT